MEKKQSGAEKRPRDRSTKVVAGVLLSNEASGWHFQRRNTIRTSWRMQSDAMLNFDTLKVHRRHGLGGSAGTHYCLQIFVLIQLTTHHLRYCCVNERDELRFTIKSEGKYVSSTLTSASPTDRHTYKARPISWVFLSSTYRNTQTSGLNRLLLQGSYCKRLSVVVCLALKE